MTDSFPRCCEILQKRKVRKKIRADHFNMSAERQRARVKGKVCVRVKWLVTPVLTSCFNSMKRLGVFLLRPPPPGSGWVTSQIVSTHLYTSWVEISTVRVKLLAQCFLPGLDGEPGIQFVGFLLLLSLGS